MNKDEDVLLVFITSHGGPTGVGLVLADAFSSVLSPDHIASVLDREGIRNRVVIVSACYSGMFTKRLASPDSIVLTASDESSPSFGCSNEREWTYFGDAFFNQSLGEGVSLQQAFEDAKVKISQWETRDELPPSSPQGHFGAVISEKLAKLKPGYELLTLYYGDGADLDEAEAVARAAGAASSGAEVQLVRGGQPHYRYLISAE